MRLRRLLGFWLSIVLATSVFAALTPTGRSVPNEVLVKIRDGASPADLSAMEEAVNGQAHAIAALGSGKILRMRSRTKGAEALQEALAHNPNVEYVEPNYIFRAAAEPNDPSYTNLWGLDNTGQIISSVTGIPGADIDAEAAWNVTTGSNAIVVGVVDTGVDYNHPDLAANMWSNPGGKGNAVCAAGTHGFNAIANTCDPMDDHGHGTHVSGTIGAVGNNGVGVAGVNWNASIMALKFLDSGGYGNTADAIEAIDFAIQAKIDGVNIRILSNSWGGGPFSKALLDIINKANENDILFVAAAGNDSSSNDTYPVYPSSYATPNLISVAATDNRDALAYFSNYGATTVHLGAPGVSVYSTMRNNNYGYLSGTSMAAPHVSGVAALALAVTPSLTTAQLKTTLLNSVDPVPSLTGKCITGGRLNAAKAVGGTPSPDFSLLVSPVSRTVLQGGTATYAITITPINGFNSSVNLTIGGLPAGASASFTPATTTSSSTLVVVTSASTPIGSSSLTITATSGAIARTSVATLWTTTTPDAGSCPEFSVYFGPYITSPTDVAMADFNRDGVIQYAFTDVGTSKVWVENSGQFTGYAVGTAPVSMLNADLNGDGRLDFATANSGSHNVSVLLANSSGGWDAAVHYSVGSSPFSVVAADFNGDGKLDLAAANNGSSNVSVLIGQGNGTFAAAVSYATGTGPFRLTTADFDRDGDQDLAVANFNANNVSVLLGNGDGTFAAAANTAAGTQPSSVAAGDFNGDGKPDLAVSNYGSNNVSVLFGNGNGTFGTAVNYSVGLKPYSVAAGDLNGDGIADLVTANSGSGSLSILIASGFGSFNSPLTISVYYEPTLARIGDLDDDGRLDILLPVQAYGRIVYVYNDSTCALNCGNFLSPAPNTIGGTPDSAVAADFNRNGPIDIAVVDSASNVVAIRTGNGDGTFAPGSSYPAGTTPRGLATADFNRDGKLDLAVASTATNEAAVLLGNGDATFQNAVAYGTGAGPRSVTVGDFNRDGKPDLAVPARDANAVSILLGNGDGTFQTKVDYSVGTSPRAVATGDFDRDGILDLAVANATSGNVSILKGNANGTFQAAVNFGAGTTPRALLVRDLNGDARPDLAVANGGSNDVSILYANGDATFASAVNYPVGTSSYAIVAADFNADGEVDLATANNASNDVSILFASGSSGYNAAVQFAAGLNPTGLVEADFNRDGKRDLVVVNSGAAGFSTLLNACPLPDLTVAKTHSGTFTQGGTGSYTITVTNAGGLATNATVTVKDTLPLGLSATTMSGTGWTCVAGSATCTRLDALAPGASYPPITLGVKVQSGAAASVTNNVTVSGGGELNSANSSASDVTTITPATDLILTKTHTGAFAQGASGRVYKLLVKNAGGLATSGTVTVADTLPAGLTATQMLGTGWSCNTGSLTCTRNDVLAGGSSYPPITLTVNVAGNAASQVTNTATVSGGGDANLANNTASDPTIVWSSQTCGSFGAPTNYNTQSQGSNLNVADFTGDGKLDILTSSYSVVSILPGSGTGTFLPPVLSTIPYSLVVKVGDLNHDGKLDLVSSNDSSDAKISVLLGNGDASFATPVEYDLGSLSYVGSIDLFDLDGDGNLDVLGRTNYYSSVVTAVVLLGNGDGTLGAPSFFSLPNNVGSSTIADVDANGTADLVLTTSNKVHVMLGNGNGTFQTAIESPLSMSVGGIAAGDFNGDGIPDLAGAAYSDAVILRGNGNGTFAAAVSYDTEYSMYSVTLADINADGALDVLTSGSSYFSTLLGKGDGTFQTANNYYVGGAYQLAVSDFNGDGKADLASSGYYYGSVGIMLGGCPDLAITKTHSGTFRGGQGGDYSIRVSNAGGGAVTGTITVQDLLPAGLTATQMYGYPGNCTLETLTCTRSSTLSPGTYWDIYLSVVVSATAPISVTNVATVSGTNDTNTANNTASDPTTIVHDPDLVVTKTHTGAVWASGQTGTYTISVGNSGTGPTSGTVSVTDSLPTGLSLTSMTGTGWNCSGTTCTRSDALAATSTYPPITVTVGVFATNPVTNYVYVYGGGDPYSSSAQDYTRILGQPFNVVATATSATQATVTWSYTAAYYGGPAPTYAVFRAAPNGDYVQVGTTLSTTYIDSSLTANKTYRYKVRAVEGAVNGPFSAADLATTMLFTDDPVVSRSTRIKRLHIEELRTAVNLARAAIGLPAFTFTDPSLAGSRIKKVHVLELRNALNEARTAMGISIVAFNDAATIKAQHITELRTAVR